MKIIHKMLEDLAEEVDGTKEYAEKYIESRVLNNTNRAEKYKEMAYDELKHAGYVRAMALEDAESLKRVYTLSEETASHWEHELKHLNEEMAIVKQMLSM